VELVAVAGEPVSSTRVLRLDRVVGALLALLLARPAVLLALLLAGPAVLLARPVRPPPLA
jgi:hypothetical protein